MIVFAHSKQTSQASSVVWTNWWLLRLAVEVNVSELSLSDSIVEILLW